MNRGLSTAIGVLLVIVGLGNSLARIFTEQRHGPLGGRHAFWHRKGFVTAPQWFSWTEVGLGVLFLLSTAIWVLLTA